MSHLHTDHSFPEDFLRPDDRSPLEGIDESFVFTYDTYSDELGEGQRWSRWEDLEALMKGPEPRPGWVVTADAAMTSIDNALAVRRNRKDYLFALKGNQPVLSQQAQEAANEAVDHAVAEAKAAGAKVPAAFFRPE